jgi:hypothetical protein
VISTVRTATCLLLAGALTVSAAAQIPASEPPHPQTAPRRPGLAGPAPASAPQDRPPAATAQQVRAEFQAICSEITASDDSYFGRASAIRLERELAREDLSVLEEISLRGQLAAEYLRLGEAARTVGLLEEALELATSSNPPPGLVERLHLDLGLAHLRLAEDENCLLAHRAGDPLAGLDGGSHHRPAVCTLPVGPESLHRYRDHTLASGEHLLQVLATNPDPLVRWLLVLGRMLAGDYPAGVPTPFRLPPAALAGTGRFPQWRNVAADLGLNVLDLAGGAVVDDLDGDGLLDVVTSTMDPCGPMKAFRNRGDGGFEEIAARWALDSQLGGLNIMPADYDNDGDLDLLVLRGAWMRGVGGRVRNSLLRNELTEASGRFVDVTASAGLAEPAYPTQAAAWGDYDGDGDLDLFVGNEATEELRFPSQLFRNDGDGRFTDVAAIVGVQNFRYAKSAAWGDYDDDGDLDLFVSNMGLNRLYRNDGAIFTDVSRTARIEEPFKSFASWFFDFDNDGDLDLFVAAYGAPAWQVAASYCCPQMLPPESGGHPILYRNDGGGRFSDASADVGLTRPLLPMGSNYGDLDNDGWLDLYLGTGIPDLSALMPNVLLRNDGGQRLEDVTFDSGMGVLQKGHGVAFSDIDNDGDQDVFEQLGGAYPADPFFNALFENPGNANGWVTLELVGTKANRKGVGARIAVTVRTGESRRTIHLLAGSGGSFGASAMRQEIGLGAAEAIESIVIRWPGSGTVSTFTDVAPNRFYRAVEGATALEPLELPRIELGKAAASAHGTHEAAGAGSKR